MGFRVVLTVGGRNSRDHVIDYLSNALGSPHVAQKFFKDYLNAVKRLESSASAYSLCEEKLLADKGIRHIHLKKYKYKVYYHLVNDNEAHIDAVLHDRQLPEKWLGR